MPAFSVIQYLYVIQGAGSALKVIFVIFKDS